MIKFWNEWIKYGHVINVGIQNTLAYRMNFLFRAVFTLIPLLANILLWKTIFSDKAEGDMIVQEVSLSNPFSEDISFLPGFSNETLRCLEINGIILVCWQYQEIS